MRPIATSIRTQFVHDATRDAIRQALMGAQPIASFAVAAGTIAPQQPPTNSANWSGGGSTLTPITPAPATSGIPHAIIPPMEEIGLGSGVGSDGGFDLSSAPLQPKIGRATSELQSPDHLVIRLLLEKKKTNKHHYP